MAKRDPRARRRHTTEPSAAPAPELSLEEILEEYRAQQAAEEAPPAPPEPESAAPLTLEPEEGVLSGQLPAEEDFPQAEPEEYGEYEEYYDVPPEPEEWEEPESPEESESPEAPEGPQREEFRRSTVSREQIEGFDDQDDFYAGYVEDRDAPSPEPGEEEPPAEDASDSETGKGGKRPGAFRLGREKGAARPHRPGEGLRGRLVGLLAVAAMRRERDKQQPPPEPEDVELEMEPRKAARHYANQLPSLRLRAIGAGIMCLLLAWLALSCAFNWPLPGELERKLRAVSLICLAGEITVLLLGLDIVTSGVMSLLRGRPGAESMIVLAAVASLLDTVAMVATGNTARGLPFCVLPATAVEFALWGSFFTGCGFYDSFMTFYHVQEDPFAVTSRPLPGTGEPGLLCVRRPVKGFIRRSEEPSLAESMAETAFLPMGAGSLALALALALGSKDPGAFFHIFALMTGLCASFGWLFAFPLLFSKTARHLQMNGGAIAGWAGAREMGVSRQLVLTDTDIFPVESVEITGIRLMNKSAEEKVIAYTGSMLATAGTGTAPMFTELMRMRKATLSQVEEFTVGEGGVKGLINGSEVRVGTAGYMHLSGVKVPDKLKADTAVYTAIDGELAGSFICRYRPTAGVQRALLALRKAHRKPIFATRDFNLDGMLLRSSFGVSTEGFRFPPYQERFELSKPPEEESGTAAGITGQEGLEALTDLFESGVSLYRMGRICAWACLGSAVLGAALMIAPCWLGSWTFASAGRVLVYMLLWTLPTAAGSMLLRK